MKRLLITLTLLISNLSYSQEYSYGRIVYRQEGDVISEELKEGEIEVLTKEGWIYITFPGYKEDQWQIRIVKEERKSNGDLFYVCSTAKEELVYMLYYKETNEFVLRVDKTNHIVFQRIKRS